MSICLSIYQLMDSRVASVFGAIMNSAINTGVQLRLSCLVAKLCPTVFATPWTVVLQIPLSMGFPRQEYWNGLLSSQPRDQTASPALARGFFTTEPPGKPVCLSTCFQLFWIYI